MRLKQSFGLAALLAALMLLLPGQLARKASSRVPWAAP